MERLSKISAKHRELLREHLEEFCIMRQFTNIPGTTQAVMRARKHKDFTAIYRRRPVEIYTFKDCEFERWIISK